MYTTLTSGNRVHIVVATHPVPGTKVRTKVACGRTASGEVGLATTKLRVTCTDCRMAAK